MDSKRLILNVVVVLAVFFAWQFGLELVYKRHPSWRPSTQPAATQLVVAATTTTTRPAGATTMAAGTATSGPAVASVHAEDHPGGSPVVLGSAAHDDGTYVLAVDVDPRGAGLSSVTLNPYFQTAERKAVYTFQEPDPVDADGTRPLATRSVTIDGRAVDVSDAAWRQTAKSAGAVTYVTRVVDGDKPLVELTKTFAIQPKDAADGSKGFEAAVGMGVRNLAGRPLAVSLVVNGPTPPRAEDTRSEDRRFVAGFDEGDKVVRHTDTFVTDVTRAKPKDLVKEKPLPVLWVGACNSYFESILRPDGGPTAAVHIAAATAVSLDDKTHDAAFAVTTNAVTIPAGASADFDCHAYFGPKQRSVLTDAYYAAYPRNYNLTLVYTSAYCGFLTFGWLIDALYDILWFFHLIFRDWGLAIIGLVVLVRTCLHPITKRSQVNMMGMSKMGPEIERLKKKYGDDKDGLNKAMMGVYKEQGLAPILGCLPMLLQTPIWLALWAALQSTFEIRQAQFLHPFGVPLTWINDLSQPDALVSFAHPIHLLFFTVRSINVLPVLLAGVFFVQQMMQPVPANQTPEQLQQRKMMRWMSLLYPVLFYVSPSGLNLYILTSTSIGIVESKIVRDHIKARDAAEAAGRIIVGGGDGPAVRSTPKRLAGKKGPEKPKGKLAKFLSDIQARAEQAVRDAEKKKGQQKR